MKSVTLLAVAFLTSVRAAGSECPFNYPAELNNTESRNGLVFTLAANNPAVNNRAIQLRPNPFFEGGFFGGVDASSPVLLGNLRGAGLYSEARNEVNQLYDLGPTAYLNQRDAQDGNVRYSFAFANATEWPGAVEQAWYLQAPGSDGTYSLFHDEAVGVVHGFLLCEADIDLDNGPWYQLFYQTYESEPYDFPGCESVGVRTTVAATIFNGECDVGGIVAS
ncbi:hypothetical protein F4778DRAFT_488727 [Xylariomycetidae sp. FL2044]|nr:hypothetical protein F4778DRAFT_488727 [Xylariomycetidae sp. FL2044]